MSEKTYITPNLKEPELVIVPMGAVNENGVKMKRKAIKFFKNSKGHGQFKTSDPKLQEHLADYMKKYPNRIIIASEQDSKEEAAASTQSAGPATSEPAVKGKPGRKPKGE